jgi:hypothetical protein
MIQVDEPPNIRDCASCQSRLVWLYSFDTGRTFAVVAVDRETFQLHRCKHAQHPETWRSLRRGDPPNDEYLAVKAQLKERTEGES